MSEEISKRMGRLENGLTKVTTTVDSHKDEILSLKKDRAAHANDIAKLYVKSDNAKEYMDAIKQDLKEGFTRIEKTLEKSESTLEQSLAVQTKALNNQQKVIDDIRTYIHKAIGATVVLVFFAGLIIKFI